MNETESLLDEVVDRLAVLRQVAHVEKFPAKSDELSRVAHPRAALWVGYAGSVYGKERALDAPVQDREILIDIGVIVRNLTGTHGAANYLDLVRTRLHGFRLSHGTPLRVRDERFVDSKQGLHRHVIVFGTRTTLVPVKDEGDPLPKFTKATILAMLEGDPNQVIEAPDEE